MRRRTSSNPTPYTLAAKYPGICAETAKPIKKGETCLYDPRTRQVYHAESAAYTQHEEQQRSQAFARAWNMPDSNW